MTIWLWQKVDPGHPFAISGRVVHGDELGRTIGFPTANVPLRRQVSPVKGVYAVEVLGLGEKPLPAWQTLEQRPTVAGIRQQLEVHLLICCNGPLRSPYTSSAA